MENEEIKDRNESSSSIDENKTGTVDSSTPETTNTEGKDPRSEHQGKTLTEMKSLDIEVDKQSLSYENVDEDLHNQTNVDKNNLPYDKMGEGSHNQTCMDRDNLLDDNVRGGLHNQTTVDKHILLDDKGGEGSLDQTTVEKHSLPDGKVRESSLDQTPPVGKNSLPDDKVGGSLLDQTSVDEHSLPDDKVGESSLDQTPIDERSLQDDKVGEGSPAQIPVDKHSLPDDKVGEGSHDQAIGTRGLGPQHQEEASLSTEEILGEEEAEPVFDGTEIPEMDAIRSSSTHSVDETEEQVYAWPEKATALKNFVKEKGAVAVSSVLRRLSGRKDENDDSLPIDEAKNDSSAASISKEEDDSNSGINRKALSQKTMERSSWNPLNYLINARDVETQNKFEHGEGVSVQNVVQSPALRGRIILYTRLGCSNCREARLLLHQKKIRYVEINIDVYPSRKAELERYTESSAVPMVFFNELPVGGLNELKAMDESGKLDEKINELITEDPPLAAPLPPLSGEDDESISGAVDELALIVRRMKESILVKDRFYKMRRFTKCFLGSEAVDFLSKDQYLSREDAIQFGRKLESKYFFRHLLEENVFEDGNHLYRFLDHDPFVSSQCYNIPRGIIDVKPKPITEIASRLRFLTYAILEAYTSEDGRHVDYRSIHGSEEFARYLRVVEELQRVEVQDMSREEKLAFFINLYNMMAIHAILICGYPTGPLERRKMLGDFKYVIGGWTYSLSAIHNGILRGNQRPPYNLVKPFSLKDGRSKMALPYPEPLVHFALVCGTRSGPALGCYSPGDIDKELVEAARNFLRNGGLVVDPEAKVASINKILRWYSIDFGKNEVEVLKHAANYLEPPKSEELLDLVANTQLKMIYQPYDWGLNC